MTIPRARATAWRALSYLQRCVSPSLGGRIARSVTRIIDEQAQPGAPRSANYLHFEARLVEIGGEEASRIHIGRSRQDLHGTARRMQLRAAFLASLEPLLDARAALLDLAGRNLDTVIPAYTHGVQAQPTTLGHYLLAFSAAFERDADRLREDWDRVNQPPLGSGPLATSGFPIDRVRLATLLGFDRPIDNSYDANFIASMAAGAEFANAWHFRPSTSASSSRTSTPSTTTRIRGSCSAMARPASARACPRRPTPGHWIESAPMPARYSETRNSSHSTPTTRPQHQYRDARLPTHGADPASGRTRTRHVPPLRPRCAGIEDRPDPGARGTER